MRIIILGSGPTHGVCPYNREVWGVNRVIRFPKFQEEGNKLFFFDNLETFNPNVMSIADLFNNKGDIEYITSAKNVEYLKKYNIPAMVYPLDEIIDKFKSKYFANSISYMVAYAMYQGVKSIAFYGIDHINYREYMIARCGLEYWAGRAQQSGIDLEVAGDSAILNTINGKLYGYDFLYDENTVPKEKFLA
jgi:hypothetical protein